MTDPTSDPPWGTERDDVPSVEERRALLEMLAVDRDGLAELTAKVGGEVADVLPFALQAISVELASTTMALMEAQETIANMKPTMVFLGRLAMGLLGGTTALTVDNLDDEDEDFVDEEDRKQYLALCNLALDTGFAIRRSAGLPPLLPPKEEPKIG